MEMIAKFKMLVIAVGACFLTWGCATKDEASQRGVSLRELKAVELTLSTYMNLKKHVVMDVSKNGESVVHPEAVKAFRKELLEDAREGRLTLSIYNDHAVVPAVFDLNVGELKIVERARNDKSVTYIWIRKNPEMRDAWQLDIRQSALRFHETTGEVELCGLIYDW